MLRPTNASRSIVEGWLAASNAPARTAGDDVADRLEFKPRPERLGLGAKYVPHTAALSTQEERLTKKLKNKTEQDTKAKKKLARDDDDDEEEEGRSGSIKSKKREPTGSSAAMAPAKSSKAARKRSSY